MNQLELFKQAQLATTRMVESVESLHLTYLVTLSNRDSHPMVLDTALTLRKGGDYLSCMHSYVRDDSAPHTGSKASTTANLKSTWETKLMTSLPQSKFNLDLKERDPATPIKEQ